MSMRRINYIISILLLSLCYFFWNDALKIRPPAHIYPKSIIVVIAFLAVVLLVQSIFFPKAIIQGNPLQGINHKRVLTTIFASIIYYYGIKYIGFYVTSYFFIVSVIWILDEKVNGIKTLGKISILGIVVMGIIYVSFKIFLKVPTPPGILF